MKIKYITVEKSDSTIDHILSKIKRELGSGKLYCYSPLIKLSGNMRILELRHEVTSDLLIKVDGPEYLLEQLQGYFIGGGKI